MRLIAFICFGVICVLMTVIYTLFNQKTGWAGLLVRGMSIFSLIVFLFVLNSLKSLTNALALYLSISIVLLLINEVVDLTTDDEYVADIFGGVLKTCAGVCMALSVVSISEFNLFALIGGVLLGLAFGFTSWAFGKYEGAWNISFKLLQFAAFGAVVGAGLCGIMFSLHSTTALILMIGSALFVITNTVKYIFNENNVVQIVTSVFYMLSLLTIVSSVYFY